MKYLNAVVLLISITAIWQKGMACGGGYVLDGTVIETGYGVVLSVDRENETVTIDHEAIQYVLKKGRTRFLIVGEKVLEEAAEANDNQIMFELMISAGEMRIAHIQLKNSSK